MPLSEVLRAQGSEQHDCIVKLRTQAGTYIKVRLQAPSGGSSDSGSACPGMHLHGAQLNDLVPIASDLLALRVSGFALQEFVHSDSGRTVPSLGSLLGCEAQILELDVVEVHMDYLASVP